jgi:acyl dehydratase
MAHDMVEEFDRRPSVAAYHARAFLPSPGLRKAGGFPRIVARWTKLRIDRRHHRAFLDVTGLPAGAGAEVLYPHVFGFPLQMVVLTHRAFPLPIWRALQVRNHLLCHRPVGGNESLELETRVAGRRILDKGAEVDLHTTLAAAGEPVWEGLTTFFYRGRHGPPQAPSALARAPEASGLETARWRMRSGVGWRFAGLTGDYNGIHWMRPYARLFGFRAAFHHSQLVLGQCLARIPAPPAPRHRLDAWLKGPVFYDTDVRLQASACHGGARFAVSMDGETRPSVVARWAAEPPGAQLVDAHDVPLGLGLDRSP